MRIQDPDNAHGGSGGSFIHDVVWRVLMPILPTKSYDKHLTDSSMEDLFSCMRILKKNLFQPAGYLFDRRADGGPEVFFRVTGRTSHQLPVPRSDPQEPAERGF